MKNFLSSSLLYLNLCCSFPLVQSKQSFKSMDLQLRKEFFDAIEKLSEKYGLDNITFASFTLQYGYRNKYSASDVVYILLAILESSVSYLKSLRIFLNMNFA